MYLIDNQHFINLEQYLNIDSFDDMWDSMCLAIGQSYADIQPGPTPQQTLYDQNETSYFDLRNKIKQQFPDLDFRQTNTVALMSKTVTIGNVLNLKVVKSYPEFYNFKHLDSYTTLTESGKNFSFLFDWINNQNCFEQFGRTVLFINWAGQKGSIHRDYYDTNLNNRKDQFIWISSKHPKKFFLFDDTTNQKHYNNYRACIFNNCNFHGSENNQNYATWSLRIDGIFNRQWSKEIGLEKYYESY